MRDMRFTSGEICQIAGIAQSTLDRWVNNELVIPRNNGEGTGVHRTYSLEDAIAISFGQSYRELECGHDVVATIIRYVSNLSQAEIKEHFDKGETILVPVAGYAHWYEPKYMIRDEKSRKIFTALDFELCFDRVLRMAEEIVQTRV
jgi:DNA-binding transcriptional MerR regulator